MIAILLSTYNGEKYIKEQLESILKQTYQKFVLIVRDDGSKDKTVEILENYSLKDKRILLIETGSNVGIKQSFFYLLNYALQYTNAQYFMFCDQDDVWLPGKLEFFLKKAVSKYPQLLHSDLVVVNEKLNKIADSFWNYQNLNPEFKTLNYLLVQNNITGCAMMINRELAKIVKYHENMIMHDWWIGLIASMFGKIEYIRIPTVLYRQHANNDIGANKYGLGYVLKKLKTSNSLTKIFNQAKGLKEIYEKDINTNYSIILENFLQLNNQNFFEKRKNIIKYKFFKSDFLRNLGLMVKI